MYAAIWRALPGPTWLKVIEALILILGIVYLLFEFAFPWILENTKLVDNTISG
ncbi:hypothetical protein [Trueperella pecoris]|uniref:Uncharacterized protein n=1 Tax=Trueperella pecoris TaxID=2733571 RepID=A0A7M1QUS9_9ACTO|nr:hypothetical protein [Trueperella pecoris]QOR45678.1 hypothetical protein INS88_00090 [Trueperella pecoris]QTG75519.1 hypothetical protein J4179_00090 [Trueperella pecoris]